MIGPYCPIWDRSIRLQLETTQAYFLKRFTLIITYPILHVEIYYLKENIRVSDKAKKWVSTNIRVSLNFLRNTENFYKKNDEIRKIKDFLFEKSWLQIYFQSNFLSNFGIS